MRLASINREAELLERLKLQDAEAFSQLYALYVKKIYAFALTILKSPALAEDVAQETFVKIWENADHIVLQRSFEGFLFTMARNIALNMLKKASRETFISDEIFTHAVQQSEDGLGYTERRQTVAFIDLAVDQLPPKRKAIYELCHNQGYSYKQTAKKLGIKDSTVNSQMVKALRYIKEYMIRNGALLWLFLLN